MIRFSKYNQDDCHEDCSIVLLQQLDTYRIDENTYTNDMDEDHLLKRKVENHKRELKR